MLIPVAESGFPIEDDQPDRIADSIAVGTDEAIDFDDSEESSPDNSDIASRASDSPGAQQYVCDAWSHSSSLAAVPRIGAGPLTARKALFYRHK